MQHPEIERITRIEQLAKNLLEVRTAEEQLEYGLAEAEDEGHSACGSLGFPLGVLHRV